MFERPIQNGQCADSTYEDKRLMKYRSHVLHSLLEGFVQRRSHLVLRNALPQKEEWVFLVKLTPIQLKIYREFIRYLREDLDSDNASANPIKAFAVCCKIWNHPDVLWNVVKKNLDLEMDLDIDEVRTIVKPNKSRGTGRPRGRPPLNGISLSSHGGGDQFDGPLFAESSSYKAETSGISLEWAKPIFENYIPEVMENGVKFELLFQLLEETVAVGDKLLVFSQSLLTLDLIEIFLKRRLSWRKTFDYVRLDGSTAGLEREKLINEFNTNSVQKLFLISTRAGSLGINLVGANRVCIFDASWNPCHDSQAVCRIYRYGQTKPCHIYRFVSDCTLEKRIYDRQVSKKGMADRVVDEMNPNAPFKSKDVSSFLVLQHDLLDKLPYIRCDLNMDKFTDPVIRNLLSKMGDTITQEPFEHESLLIDQKHQRLSKSEKRLALKNYEKEKQTVANAYATYSRPSYTQYYNSINPLPSSTSSSYNASSSSYSRYSGHRSTVSSLHKSSSAHSSSVDSHRSMSSSATYDRFELHINALKSRGISVYPVELHQDTYLNDPSGTQDMYIRAGEKVYILVSQKGTYLRVQGKLLRVPYVGTEMNQEQAEHFVMSLLQLPAAEDRRSTLSMSHVYPAEQPLPPSNTLFQKNANHLQITNSRNNSGGDVMMATSNWNASSGSSNSNSANIQQQQQKSSAAGTTLNQYLNDDYRSKNGSYSSPASHSQSDLQSLTRLAETFCQLGPSADPFSSDSSKQWTPSPSTPKQREGVVSPPELEVIKLNHSHSQSPSSSSNSNSSRSNSRTNSPYRQNWNSNSAHDSNGSGLAYKDNHNFVKQPDNSSFYTDFLR
ncbi:Helicase ARIP4 [Orchesella cincta]|uniref:Helicase ARIP4 n=1 Tax=Orchesella cincta TaxID=48709 RepID=A0A1D2MPR8_ORCCI|nr:Helicase ARIP4 [Orchesella cincta]